MNLIRRQTPSATSWRPLREMDLFNEQLSRLFGRSPSNGDKEALSVADWTPSVNIQETKKEYQIRAELPAVDKQDVQVKLQDGVLTVEGERKLEEEEKNAKFHRVECAYGHFLRRFSMPDDADEKNISASFKNGMLTVKVQRLPEKRPSTKKIVIS